MVLTRAASKHLSGVEAPVKAPVAIGKKSTAAAVKQHKDTERALLEESRKNCLAAQKRRAAADAAAYIGTMKFLGAIITLNNKTAIPQNSNIFYQLLYLLMLSGKT